MIKKPRLLPSTPAHQVLPKPARDHAKQVAASPQRAEKFLRDAGIISKAGQLAPNYR